MKVTVSRRGHFNAAHRLYVKDWSEEKNSNVFGNVITQIFMVTIMNLLLM